VDMSTVCCASVWSCVYNEGDAFVCSLSECGIEVELVWSIDVGDRRIDWSTCGVCMNVVCCDVGWGASFAPGWLWWGLILLSSVVYSVQSDVSSSLACMG
jgi:hypothetical protein